MSSSSSSSSSSSLPTPRQLLTSLLNAIAAIPAPESEQREQQQQQQQQQTQTKLRTEKFSGNRPGSNPLRLIDPSHRSLFTTLHVLFPSLLLPALDLLDRGLVTCLTTDGVNHPTRGNDANDDDNASYGDGDGDVKMRTTDDTNSSRTIPSPTKKVYQVRSAQKSYRGRRGGDSGGEWSVEGMNPLLDMGIGTATGMGQQQKTVFYIVHTSAWNCTCAAFTFAAFPLLTGASLLRTAASEGKEEEEEWEERETEGIDADNIRRRDESWQFGGLSLDGMGKANDGDGSLPPCCKHLLACILAERWQPVLGRYVIQRIVGKEEMAGIFADI